MAKKKEVKEEPKKEEVKKEDSNMPEHIRLRLAEQEKKKK